MNCRMKMLLFILLIPLFIFPWSSRLLSLPKYVKNNAQNLHILADSPLDIDGNAQLAAAASLGDGSSWNPYIIQDKIINASGLGTDGIRIGNTTAHFILRNCLVTDADDPYAGIYLRNVTNARLENNTAYNNDAKGISLRSCYNNTLTGNTANYNYDGIYLRSTWNNTLMGNTANYNHGGIYLHDHCYNTTLSGNTANHNYDGIRLDSSDQNTLTGNTANHNSEGIYIGGDYNNLTGNIVSYNWAGIELYHSNGNTLTINIVTFNYYGILLDDSNYNIVVNNNLCWNSEDIAELSCTGNILVGNACVGIIPGFTWPLILLGVTGLSLLALAIKRKEGFQTLSLS